MNVNQSDGKCELEDVISGRYRVCSPTGPAINRWKNPTDANFTPDSKKTPSNTTATTSNLLTVLHIAQYAVFSGNEKLFLTLQMEGQTHCIVGNSNALGCTL